MVRTKEDYQIERNIKRKSEKRKAEEKEMRHTIEYRETKNKCFRKERLGPMDEIVRRRIS